MRKWKDLASGWESEDKDLGPEGKIHFLFDLRFLTCKIWLGIQPVSFLELMWRFRIYISTGSIPEAIQFEMWRAYTKAWGQCPVFPPREEWVGEDNWRGRKVHRCSNSSGHPVLAPRKWVFQCPLDVGPIPTHSCLRTLVVKWERPQWSSNNNTYFMVVFIENSQCCIYWIYTMCQALWLVPFTDFVHLFHPTNNYWAHSMCPT